MAIALAFVVFFLGGKMDIMLGLGGLAGLAYLLTPGPILPNEKDYNKALEKLATDANDPEANTIVGKYKAFVLGDYNEGMLFMTKSGDKALQTLAEHERDETHTASGPLKVGMGDEWTAAAKSFKPLYRIFYDRASYWYGLAWPDMRTQPLWGDKLRERLQRLYTVVPGQPAPNKLALPSSWQSPYAETKAFRSQAAARAGSYSMRIASWKTPMPSYTAFGQTVDVKPGLYKISAWVITDGTDQDEGFLIAVQNQAGNNIILKPMPVLKDEPWWKKVSTDVEVPAGGIRIILAFNIGSKAGTIYVDDVSIKGVDGKELLKNGSFEDR